MFYNFYIHLGSTNHPSFRPFFSAWANLTSEPPDLGGMKNRPPLLEESKWTCGELKPNIRYIFIYLYIYRYR